MPNRWIKEAYCTSPRIGAVGPDARDLWVRLLVKADDHGYFHGGAQLVSSLCFPLQPNARKCEQLLRELILAELIVRYESGGKQYLAVTQWYERSRSNPKFPAPPESLSAQLHGHENICTQVPATASLHVHVLNTTITLEEGGWDGISELDRSTWKAAYPIVNIDSELAKARSWVIANPAQRKSNWRRFLNGWLSRAKPPGNGKEQTQAQKRASVARAIFGERKADDDAIDGTAERVA